MFSKPGTVRVVFTRTFLLNLSLWLEDSRILATGFEFLQLLWSSPTCPPLPASPAGLGRKAVCSPMVSWREPSFLPVRRVSSTLPVAKVWRHKGLIPAGRKFRGGAGGGSLAHLAGGVWTTAEVVMTRKSLFEAGKKPRDSVPGGWCQTTSLADWPSPTHTNIQSKLPRSVQSR